MMKFKVLVFLLVMIITSCKNNPSDISIQHIKEFDSTLNYQIDIDYPTFSSLNASILNELIKSRIDSNIFEFKKFILDFDKNFTRTLTYHYEIKTNNGQYISLAQSIEWAIPGIERILYQNYNINYDIANSRLIRIEELFTNPINFRDSLKYIVENQLKEESICSFDTSENFENFFFNNDTIFFNISYNESHQCDNYPIAIDRKRLRNMLK
ncbi:MAG: hypothetical protein HXX16_19500 [Bacteroidales bacterium]|nr:hypothetical protein [Bacteroidales bacterium]